MKKTVLRKCHALSLFFVGLVLGFQYSLSAQTVPCIVFPQGGNGATINIYNPWVTPQGTLGNTNASHNPAYFIDTITSGDKVIPDGTYLGWCLDFEDLINATPTTYPADLFSSCDTNLDSEIKALGLGYPTDAYVSPVVWNQINYLLNHKNGAYFNDIQIALWNLIGGPGSEQAILAGVPNPPNPPYNTNEVNSLLLSISNNAANWQMQCGDVSGVIVAVLDGDYNPVQLTMIEVTNQCPIISVTPINSCYTSLAAAESAALAAATGTSTCTGGSNLTFTVSSSGPSCATTITVTGTDKCGLTASTNFTVTILTNAPQFGPIPLPTNVTVQCVEDIPATNHLTATDSCGNALTVNFSQTESNPNSICYNIITRTWSVMDCAGQTNTWTQVITQFDDITPTLITNAIAKCYTSLAAADAAALAATSTNTIGCNGTNMTFTVTDNGQYCPATIVVTAMDACSNTASATYTALIVPAPPTIMGLPPGSNYGCNPLTVPTNISGLTATNDCGSASISQTNFITTNSCAVMQIFTIAALDDCGNLTTAYVTNTWTANTTPPVINGLPAGTNYGCNPTNVPSTLDGLSASNACGTANITVTPAYSTNGCAITQVFTVVALDGCGNMSTAYVTNTWTANTTPPVINGMPAGANLGCNPTNVPATLNGLTASNACGTASITVTPAITTNGCLVTQVFTVVAVDGCNNMTTAYVTNTWTANTTPPVISGLPAGTNYGCNPASVPSTINGLSASNACGTAGITVTPAITTNGCLVTQVFTVVAVDGCNNMTTAYVTNTWTANTTPPVINGLPVGTNYGCNPTNVPSTINGLSASNACGLANITVTPALSTNNCLVVQVFTVVAVDGCGNMTTAYVTNTWTANTIPPTISGVPTNAFLACNPNLAPDDTNIAAEINVIGQCGVPAVSVTHIDATNDCTGSRTFKIVAIDGCGNVTTTNVVYTWTAVALVSQATQGNGNGPWSTAISFTGSGPLDMSAFGASNDVDELTATFTGVGLNSVTNDGMGNMDLGGNYNIFVTVTIPPDPQFGLTPKINITQPTNGTDPGLNLTVYPGMPVVLDPSSVFSGLFPQIDGAYYTGTDSNTVTSVFRFVNAGGDLPYSISFNGPAALLLGDPPTVTQTNNTYIYSYANSILLLTTTVEGIDPTLDLELVGTVNIAATVTNSSSIESVPAPPVITGVPAGTNYGCNPTSVLTSAKLQALVSATETCSPATVTVVDSASTNGCAVTDIFTVTAINTCGAVSTAYVTNTWTANTNAPGFSGVPTGSNLGCNPTNVPNSVSILAGVSASGACGTASVSATENDSTNGCVVTQIFTIVAVDGCGNTNDAFVTNTWTANTTAPVIQGIPVGTNYGCNPASVLSCATLLSKLSASNACGTAAITVTNSTTKVGCAVTEVFTIVAVDGCNNTATAYLTNTWTANTNTPVITGVPAGTNFGCNPATVPTAASVKALVSANDACGSAGVSVTGACTTNGCLVTQVFTIVALDGCNNASTAYVTNTWTANKATPTITGLPAGTNYGCNPSSVLTSSALLAELGANSPCGTAGLSVTNTTTTSGCNVTEIFTIIAVDGCGNTATAYLTNSWTANTNTPTIYGLPAGKNLGCNPTNIPTAASITNVTASDTCSTAAVNVTGGVATTNGCQASQIFTITAVDNCGNIAKAYVTNTWTANTVAPILGGIPVGTNLGCNPKTIPTLASVQSSVFSTNDTCSPATIVVTGGVPVTNNCAVSQVFTIVATNACGNMATASVTNTWTANLVAPIIGGVPAGKNLGCNPTNIPTLASIQSSVFSTNDTCSPATVLVSGGTPVTNGCGVTQVFMVLATNACGNTATAYVTNTWTAAPTILVTNTSYSTNTIILTNTSFSTNISYSTNTTLTTNITITTNCCTNSLCGSFNGYNPGSGWLWLNCHISGNPGSNCTVNVSGGSVTLSCTDGKTYTFPVPNGQICFSSSCTVATNWFDGTSWHTTLPCTGDNGIFAQGCAIPWQSDFANCKSACWTACFSCSTPGFNCNWQWGAACFNNTQPACGSIAPKACLQTSCPNGQYYSSGDQCGTPENHKPYCVAGGTGYGGGNCTGSWTGTSTTCTFGTVTNITVTPVTSIVTNTTVKTNITTTPVPVVTTNSTVTTTTAGPVLSGVPTGMYLGCNPTNIPTVATILAEVSASTTCSSANINVTQVNTTNGCLVTQAFTITAANACGNVTTAYVTNSWTANTVPPVITGVPTNAFLGCGITNLPGDTNIYAEIKATGQCGTANLVVSHQDSTNGCQGTRVFTITATDGCGNMTVTNLTYTWTGKVPETCTNSLCGGFNSQNPGSGWLWLNAHCSGNPGVPATLYCSNATVTLNCTDGKSYTFPVPNGIINFASGCTNATNWFDGVNWNTTLPCSGDSEIFLQGCAIPWQKDFASCQSVCWSGVFSCTTPGLSFNWQWGAACYANTQPTNYTTICPKACLQTSCANGQYFSQSDHAGCPENHKPYCVGGGTGGGGGNYCGSWSGTDTTCTFTSGTLTPPTLNGVPANDNLGVNPTNIPTVASVSKLVSATDTCSPAPVVVTVSQTTNFCSVTQIFTIGATNDCGAYALAYVTNTWSTMAMTNSCTNTICSTFNGSNPGSGWVWLNSQLSGMPGSKDVYVICSNATVTLNCKDGKTYTFPVPNGQIHFATNCTTATNWFDGTNWNTTLPCGGDDQIFVGGCAIPWQSDFANCQICWSGVYSCNVPGLSFNWQFGASCYSDTCPTDYNSICSKATHQTPCQNGQYFNQSHCAGTPENHNPYCVSGGTGYGGSNYTGSFCNPGVCKF